MTRPTRHVTVGAAAVSGRSSHWGDWSDPPVTPLGWWILARSPAGSWTEVAGFTMAIYIYIYIYRYWNDKWYYNGITNEGIYEYNIYIYNSISLRDVSWKAEMLRCLCVSLKASLKSIWLSDHLSFYPYGSPYLWTYHLIWFDPIESDLGLRTKLAKPPIISFLILFVFFFVLIWSCLFWPYLIWSYPFFLSYGFDLSYCYLSYLIYLINLIYLISSIRSILSIKSS